LEHNGLDKHTISQMIENNNTIAEWITTEIDLNQALFPNYETPDDVKKLYEENKDELVINEG
jgi:DNA polymerase III alpha subunit